MTRSRRILQHTRCTYSHCLERNVHTTKGYGHSAVSYLIMRTDSHHFIIKYCWEITSAIIVNSHHFFHQHLIPSDYNKRVVDFPTSLLDITAQAVQQFSLLTHSDFPQKWEITTIFGFSPLNRQGGENDFGGGRGGGENLFGGGRRGGANQWQRGDSFNSCDYARQQQAMTSHITTMSLQVTNGLDQMFNKL